MIKITKNLLFLLIFLGPILYEWLCKDMTIKESYHHVKWVMGVQ